jgi:hypothetical protein
MKQRIAAAVFALAAAQAAAEPIVFLDTLWTTSVFSSAGGASNSAGDSAPVSPLPIFATAPTADLDATASGDAIADANVLAALATAIASLDGAASAVASSGFLGGFIAPGGLLSLLLDIDTSLTAGLGNGSGDGAVRVTLVSGPDRLIDEIVRTTGVLERTFDIPFGTAGFLSVEAFGTSEAGMLGDLGIGSANVTFGLRRVPEPAGLALLLAMALAAAAVRRGAWRRSASWAAAAHPG